MRIGCFPHCYYLSEASRSEASRSEASRLVEVGKALVSLGQNVQFFSHGGPYERVAQDAGFEVVSIEPTMSSERAPEYMLFNRGERGAPGSFFTYEELKEYVPREGDALRQVGADAVLIGWNLPSYLSVQLAGIPILVQQRGSFTAPFFEMGLSEFAPALNLPGVNLIPRGVLNWLTNWFALRVKLWIGPFNRLAQELGLPEYRSTLDLMAGDLTLVMDDPEILGIPPAESRSF